MNTIRPTFVLTAIVLLSTRPAAPAALHEADHPRFGAHSLTFDTTTGLMWLDLSLSLNFSYLQAEAATQPGGLFEGFRHATAGEVSTLFRSAGFEDGFIPATDPRVASINDLSALMRANAGPGLIGISGSRTASDAVAVPYATSGFANGVAGYFVNSSPGTIGALGYGLDSNSGFGHWLVAVPEPSVMALGICGVISLWCLRGRWGRN